MTAVDPTKPRRPHRRTKSPAEAVNGAVENGEATDIDALKAQNQALMARLEKLETSQDTMRLVEPTPEPRLDQRQAEPLYSSPFLSSLLDQTRPVPKDFGGDQEPTYNVPLRLFAKPDGTIVALQGDSKSVRYYQEKGFHLLSRDEQAHYEQVERPKIVAAQRRAAHLITTIRSMFRREPSLIGFREDNEYDLNLGRMSIAQLEDEWNDLRARSINPGQRMPPMPRFRSDEAPDKALAGVDTTPTRAATERGIVPQPQHPGRDVEVTAANFNQFR